VCLLRLSDDRAQRARFERFINNDRVSVAEMVDRVGERTAALARGRHVLAIQDTSEINYQAKAGRKRGLGTVGNGTDIGLFVHPVLVVDAKDGGCYGLAHAQVWCRKKPKAANYRQLPIEKKESNRWLVGAQGAKEVLAEASLVTHVTDREGDIFEQFARQPDERNHLLTRASQDRALRKGGRLFATLDSWKEVARYTVDLPARVGKRSARLAELAIRFGTVDIRRPKSCSDPAAPSSVRMTAVDVREVEPPAGEEAVHWRLLTTHTVTNEREARQVVDWYRLRWNIEQLFRTLKRQGIDVEGSMIESGPALKRLAMLALIAATKTMQLVLARDPAAGRMPIERVFDEDEIAFIEALQPSLQGRTEKQQNPHLRGTLGRGSWTIARLGGWNGYASERPPGPITMRNGLQRFDAMLQGWLLANVPIKQDVCRR
jgi:DDE family transposase